MTHDHSPSISHFADLPTLFAQMTATCPPLAERIVVEGPGMSKIIICIALH